MELAAHEIKRYTYLRTDELLELKTQSEIPESGDIIVVAPDNHAFVNNYRSEIEGKAPKGGFLIKSIKSNGRNILFIAGDDAVSTLYGAYRYAEHLGISFGLADDVIPDEKMELDITGYDEAGKPLVETRGILPFHDFPAGPDFWDTEDYMEVIGQLPKLGMNFIGLHTYPRWSTVEEREWNEPQGPEPAVWIGLPQDINEDGTVSWAYPSYWAHTRRPDNIWGFSSRETSNFYAGANKVFDQDGYGSEVYADGEMPKDVESNISVFNRTGQMFNEAFTHAQNLGVKTAVGTELPLGLEPKGPEVQQDWVRGMPPELQERIRSKGMDPADPNVVKEVYKGIFKRIMQTHPLDYYWLWSWEVWSRYGVSEEQIHAYEQDMQLALEALNEVDAPFQLAKAGWILGTDENPAEFDDDLPPEVPFHGLWDEALGFEELKEQRVKWAATWFEEDWGLEQPQLELTRIYKDIKAGLEKGSDGVIAKHWRTRMISMNAGAMKDLLWNYGPVGSEIPTTVPSNKDRWMKQFYQDWATSRFGPEAATEIASVFYQLDKAGGGETSEYEYPMPLEWALGAPGAIMPNENDWDEVKTSYNFVDDFTAVSSQITGSGNRARYNYWLNTFEAFRTIGEYGTMRHDFRVALEDEEDSRAALTKRNQMARLWEELMALEIPRITNENELGEIASLEILTWYQLMMLQWDERLEEELGEPIPAEAYPSKEYAGPSIVRVMPTRTHLYRGEKLDGSAIVMGDPLSVKLHWRPLGEEEFQTVDCPNIARAVYQLSLPAQQEDFEYYVEAEFEEESLLFPETAPNMNQTIVVNGQSEPSVN